MTPKEKADELINKYLTSRDANQWDDVRDVHAAIRCALIAVDEILEGLGYNKLSDSPYTTLEARQYYVQVKQEIEKL
jgi:hypothetical protein